MLGWMILFAILALLAPFTILLGNESLAPEIGGFVFALLFVIGLATRWARGRAW
jgi:hypothetical protein